MPKFNEDIDFSGLSRETAIEKGKKWKEQHEPKRPESRYPETHHRPPEQSSATHPWSTTDVRDDPEEPASAGDLPWYKRFGKAMMGHFQNTGANLMETAGVKSDRMGGTAMTGIYDDYVQASQRRISALDKLLADPLITAEDRKLANEQMRMEREQLAIYEAAGRANREQGAAARGAADEIGMKAQMSLSEATEGMTPLGGKLLSGAAGLATIVPQAMIPGGTLIRAADIGGGAARNYRYNQIESGRPYDVKEADRAGNIAGAGVLAGAGASMAASYAGLNLLKTFNKQNSVPWNVVKGGAVASTYAGSEAALNELSNAVTYDDYKPDWSSIGGSMLNAFAFGAIREFVRDVKVTRGNKQIARAMSEELQKRYEAAQIIMASGSPEQQAQAAKSVMDASTKVYDSIRDMQIIGAQKEVSAINDFLGRIYQEMQVVANGAAPKVSAPVRSAPPAVMKPGKPAPVAAIAGPAPSPKVPPVPTASVVPPLAPPVVETPKADVPVKPAAKPSVRPEYDPKGMAHLAETLGENGKKAMFSAYHQEVTTADYAGDFIRVYNAARTGATIPDSPHLTEAQAFAAQASGERDKVVVAENATTPTVVKNETVGPDIAVTTKQNPAPAADKPAPAETGKPYTATLYHGSGKAASEIYNDVEYPVAGKGTYYAMNEDQAKAYGDKIDVKEISLKSPVVIRDDEEWRRLTDEAGWAFPNMFGSSKEDIIAAADSMRQHILDSGHDGLVIQYDEHRRGDVNELTGGRIKSLDNVFGHDQVVVYGHEDEPSSENTPKATKETEQEATTKMSVEEFSEMLRRSDFTRDGIRYSVSYHPGDGKYYGSIDRDTSVLGGMLSDARANIYNGGPYNTRKEAIADIAAVASNPHNNLMPSAMKPVAEKNAAGYNDSEKTHSTEAVARKEKEQTEIMERYGVTEDEAWAIKEYKSAESYKINAKLRVDMPLDEFQSKIVAFIDSALEKLPKYKEVAYRNLSFDDFGGKEEFEAFLATHQKGDIVPYSAYTSASTKKDGYPVSGEYIVKMAIKGQDGAILAGFGNNMESEVLFRRDSVFEVIDVKYGKDNVPYIIMQEVAYGVEESGSSGPVSGTGRGKQERASEIGRPVVQPVQEANPGGQVRGASGGNPEEHPVRTGELQGVQAKVNNSPAGEEPSKPPQQQIADEVRKYLDRNHDFTPARLFEIADKAFGGSMAEGTYTVKDAYDGLELAVNQYLMESPAVKAGNGDAASARATLKQMEDLLKLIPTQTKRTEEQESFQQFSTPPNIAYLAAWSANVTPADVVLEPSAGIGGLALWPKAWGATVYGNELSPRRLEFLNQLGLDGTFNLNAEQIDNLLPDNIKPSVVIMNPPFSATAGRTKTNKTSNAKRHIEQALERLENGGRLVAILGRGMADDSKTFHSWWDELREQYTVRANIQIDGSNYRKYGTNFDVQMVVIDKIGPNQEPTLTGTVKDLSEVPGMMEGIRNGRKETVRTGNVISERVADARPVLTRDPNDERTAGSASDVLGRGERRPSSGVPSDRARKPKNPGPDKRSGGLGESGGLRTRSEGNKSSGGGSGKQPDGKRLDGENAGPRMALSGGTENHSGPGTVVAGSGEQVNENSVYSTYTPKKVHIKGAVKHPARLVESAAMAAVEPPDVTYTPYLPAEIAQKGILSDAQLENVVYAGQAHQQTLASGLRKGYFIGDGTGVGKGRQIAGIILDNFLQKREKAVWLSATPELINDAKRDWKALGGNPGDIIAMNDPKLLKNGIQAEKGVVFGAYSTLAYPKNKEARFKMLQNWLGKDFDGVIAFDEAHKMGNSVVIKKGRGKSKPSGQAITGIELQRAFPNARVVYASATGATDISQYGYLERLGLWGKGTAFNDLNDFIEKISNGGLAAMELVARDMKAMGVYMARSISYDDVKYDTIQHDLTPMQTEIYNTMSKAWQKVLQNVNEALKVTGADKDGRARGAAYSALFGGEQRFYNQILTSMAMPSVIEDIKKELAAGRSCVLQLTNTNEAQAKRAIAKNEAAGGSLDDIDLTPSEMLSSMVEKSFPVTLYEEYTDEDGRNRSRPVVDADGNPVLDKKAVRMRDNLIAELQQMRVPDGPLEMLFDAFGVDQVAEVTGRPRRIVERRDDNGELHRVLENRNAATGGTADAKMFQAGKKRILVFSQAGGTGFSYHADLQAKNQQQRVHYLLQAGWSASAAVQGFGRTHRSNQASAPIVRLVTTNVMGQKRFTSTIARRLDQLGALTKGQRQAGSGVFNEKDNLENPIAEDALSVFYKGADRNILKKLGLYDSLVDEHGQIKDSSENLRKTSTFLNRILALEVEEQNEVFQSFYDTFEHMMDVAIANGTVDMGLENYVADKIEVVDEKTIRKDDTGADTKYVQMKAYKKPEIIDYQYGRGKAHGNVITVLKGGNPEFWKINDPLLLSSITHMSQGKMDGILDAYAVVSRFMTSNITGNNILWSIFSNAPRDLMTMYTYSKDKNPMHIFGGIASAYANKIKGEGADPLYKEYLSMGGGNISAYTADRDLAKKARQKLSGEKYQWWNPIEAISFVSDLIEMGPRFATYKMMRQRGMTPQEAFYESCDITVNFRRGGTVSRQINKVIPFFNASVQGIDKFARWISASDVPVKDRKKVARGRVYAYLAASAALAGLIYAINNWDDESQKNYQQLSNYTKNSYWMIPVGDGRYFAIPKPRELAVLSSFFETAAEYFAGENEHAFDEFYDYAADNFLPNVASDFAKGDWQGALGSLGIIGTGAYLMANRDFLGRPIVSSGLQYQEPKDQYNERTSKIAWAVGQAFNISPQKIDFFFSNVLGGFWKGQKALFPVGGENRDWTMGVRNTWVKDNQYSTDLVNWLYTAAEESTRAKNSDKGNMDKAIQSRMDNNMTSFYSHYYGLAKGEPESTAGRGTRQIVLDMISEYRKAHDHGELTRAQKAVYDVVKATDDTDLLPSTMPVTVRDGNDKKHTLSSSQYVEYQTDYLRRYWECVEQGGLKSASSKEERVAILKAAKKVAKEGATNRALSRIGAPQTAFKEEYNEIPDKVIIQFVAGLDQIRRARKADPDRADTIEFQDEVIELIDGLGLDSDTSATLFRTQYDSDYNNPWAW